MNRAERRRRTKRTIKKRKEKLKFLIPEYSEEVVDGYLKNNNEMNKYGSAGRSMKTNRRKSHSSYRHKGGRFGKADNYIPHDQRQIDRGKYNEDSN